MATEMPPLKHSSEPTGKVFLAVMLSMLYVPVLCIFNVCGFAALREKN